MDAWGLIDKASQILGVIAFFPIVGTGWLVLGQERRRRRELKAIRELPGSRPAALIIDIGSGPIRAQVENWLGQQEALRQVLDPDDVYCMNYDRHLTPDQVESVMKDLRQKLEAMMVKGTDKIHLFYRGPAVLAAMIGAEMSNWTAVILYHHQPNSGYENWGPLNRKPR